MDDRELLELAAKAAGYEVRWHEHWNCFVHIGPFNTDNPPTLAGQRMPWAPLTDDGDALRLAVKLNLHITSSLSTAWVSHMQVTETEPMGEDPYAATRRAIVRAAASLGEKT